MQISPEVWDVIKLCAGAYFVFILNRTDRNQRELFKRLRAVELICAANHGLKLKGDGDENS